MSIETLKTDLVQEINSLAGDQSALEAVTNEIVEHIFDNCNIADLDTVQDQIRNTCRRKRKE